MEGAMFVTAMNGYTHPQPLVRLRAGNHQPALRIR